MSTSTLVDLLQYRASTQPDRVAYTWLADAETEQESTNYAQLDERARRIGALLQERGITGRALLVYPPGLDFIYAFFGCLYAGVIAVPSAYPYQNRSLSRLQSIARDAQPGVGLTVSGGATTKRLTGLEEHPNICWITTENLDPRPSANWCPPSISEATVAMLQYTSGSTSTPKGVLVSHKNILHNEGLIQSWFGQTPEDVVLSWLPTHHDMGLIGCVLQPLYVGCRCILMPPTAFTERPVRWLNAISRYRATTSGGPNFAYELCARNDPKDSVHLDLSCWTVAFNGSEPIRHETIERFAAVFAKYGFRKQAFCPCYGLAEATLLAAGTSRSSALRIKRVQEKGLSHDVVIEGRAGTADKVLVSSGSITQQQVLIVDPVKHEICARSKIGEIWITGPSVADGYWNRPLETEEVFGARLRDDNKQRFLRTGDLGFLEDGHLYVTGRLKDIVIVHGVNHYPQDIEATIEKSDPNLRPASCATFGFEESGEERLAVVLEASPRNLERNGNLIDKIRCRVAEEHDLQVYAVVIVRPGRIPRTTSGKIQRGSCKQQFLAGTLPAILEWRDDETTLTGASQQAALLSSVDAAEAWLVRQISSLLGVGQTRIDTATTICSLGMSSMRMLRLIHALQSAGVSVGFTDFLEISSIAELAAHVASVARTETKASGAPKPRDDRIDRSTLSYGQKALWFLSQLTPGNCAHNLPVALRLRTEIEIPCLRWALTQLFIRHAILSACFSEREGIPTQRIDQAANLHLEVRDAVTWTETELQEYIHSVLETPFDLTKAPLVRAVLFVRAPNDYILLLIFHHIIADFSSITIVIQDLCRYYNAKKQHLAVPEETARQFTCEYMQYIRWQSALVEGAEGERLSSYWREQLRDLARVDLPTDRLRRAERVDMGACHTFRLSESTTNAIRLFAEKNGTSVFSVLLAAYKTVLYRYTGQSDISVGSPASGRSQAAFANAVGYFVNPVVIRTRFTPGLSFQQLVLDVSRTVRTAVAHQDLPYPLLVERLQANRDGSRSPFFQTMFTHFEAPPGLAEQAALFAVDKERTTVNIAGLDLECYPVPERKPEFDLVIYSAVADETMLTFKYDPNLFDGSRVEHIAAHWTRLLESGIANPADCVAELPMLSAGEQQQVLYEWNNTEVEYRLSYIHELIEEQAFRTPKQIALYGRSQQYTYQQLDEQSNQVAQYLQTFQIAAETPIGVLIERSPTMVVALLGILKAGAAYLPLDRSYPNDRLRIIIENAKSPLVFTSKVLEEKIRDVNTKTLILESEWDKIQQCSIERPKVTLTPKTLAYITYTSGSTGQPKGVMISHGSVVNCFVGMDRCIGERPSGALLALTSICFDISVLELFWTLSRGFCVVIDDAHRMSELHQEDPPEVTALGPITYLQCTPSLIPLIDAGDGWNGKLAALKNLILGGEALTVSLLEDIRAKFNGDVYNMYGPTETTIWSSGGKIDRSAARITLGRPIANTQIFVLDRHFQPVPVGVPGELFIAGDGLARGYLGRPDTTAAKFIPNPFSRTTGCRMYRTGDIGRFCEDGEIEYMGRVDFQVKIRGHRIEPDEIETTLALHSAVKQATVMANASAGGGQELVAYVVLKSDDTAQEFGLSEFLRTKLPDYMVPAAFVLLDQMPVTATGKLDRAALARLHHAGPSANHVEPRSTLEEVLCGMWSELLGGKRIGIYDNFFEVGGHSLMASQFISRVRMCLRVNIPLSEFFSMPTVAALAASLRREAGDGVDRTAEAVKRLSQMSDAEVDRLLTTEMAYGSQV